MIKRSTIMAMPVTINVVDKEVLERDIEEVFEYLRRMDEKFSTFNDESETNKINRGELEEKEYSTEMRGVLDLSDQTKKDTDGYFNVFDNAGKLDPAGIVKGLAIYEGSKILIKKGFCNFYFEIAGDIQAQGRNEEGGKWRIGIRNPFNRNEIIKVVKLSNQGIATSGTYIRGEHIRIPFDNNIANEIISLTVIGPNVYEADRFATAAFAMGMAGLKFLETKDGFEGYMVTKDKRAYFTEGFERYAVQK